MRRILRTLAGLAAGALLLQALPAFAELEKSEDGLWELRTYENDVVSVYLTDKTIETAEVPAQVKGMTITKIEVDCFKDCENLKSVKLPETITSIEDYSFYNCPALEEVNIPESVQNIGFQAFYGCASVERFRIPAGTEEIEQFAFEGCSSLTGVDVAKGNPNYKDEDGILFNIDGSHLILYPPAREGEHYALPAGCTVIEDYAFIGCTNLKTVQMDKIKELGEDAFYYCTALESAEVPEGITELDGAVFGNCQSLKSVSLPEGLTSVGSGCFYNCIALEEIVLPETVETLGEYAFFNCGALHELRLTKNARSIGDYALGFYYGEEEKPVRLPRFTVDAPRDSAAYDYCVKNSIKCTGGVTQNSVFIVIVLAVVVLAVVIVIIIIAVQSSYRKRYGLN